MKRFAVLFGIIAISTVVVTTSSFAEAPSVKDLPNLRLLYDNGGAVSDELIPLATDAYDVFGFVKDYNNVPADLTVSISTIVPPAVTVDFQASSSVHGVSVALVDVYAGSAAGWGQYSVTVDDASTAGKGIISANAWDNSDVAFAKYSTFNVQGPAIDTGRLFDPVAADTQFFTCVNLGNGIVTPAIPVNPSATAVDWKLYLNSVTINDPTANYDLNGNYMGLVPNFIDSADQGIALNQDGFSWLIGADGSLSISGPGDIANGPWLVGIMAVNEADPADSDTTRIMVGKGLLAAAIGDTPTAGGSETFDSLPLSPAGQIPAAINYETNPVTGTWRPVGGYVVDPVHDLGDPIAAGSHWTYNIMASTDTFVDAVPIDVVTTPNPIAGVAEGRCLKMAMTGATADPTLANALRNDGFRINSRLFPGMEYGKVYTFAMSIATDAATPANLPNYQMVVASGDGCLAMGMENSISPQIMDAIGQPLVPLALPLASQGWATISVNYTPPATPKFNDINADGQFNDTDLNLLYTYDSQYKGASPATPFNPLIYAFCIVRMWTRPNTQVTVWIDNMRFFESVYEIDLANNVQELNDQYWDTDFDTLAGLGLVEDTTYAFDGTMEAYVADPGLTVEQELNRIGMTVSHAAGPTGARNGVAAGSLATRKKYDAYATTYSVSEDQGIDHTRNGMSGNSLKLILRGPTSETPTTEQQTYIATVTTDVIAANGSGIYVFESYIATQGTVNTVTTSKRVPEIRVVLQEMKPNVYGNVSGMIFGMGGLPDVGGELPFNWFRNVVTMYSQDCVAIRGAYQIMDAHGLVGSPIQVSTFDAPIFVDDMKLYRVDDNIDFFNPELFNM